NNGSAAAASEITGSILRLDDDGTVPTDNPLDTDHNGTDVTDPIFAYGIRNSFGLVFDPITGDLWESENGPSSMDEINHVIPGFNGGWNVQMGPASTIPPPGLVNLSGSTYVDPAYSIVTTVAPTGVAFASNNSSLGGAYVNQLFVGDYNLGQIYHFSLNAMRDGFALADVLANNPAQLNQHRFARGLGGGHSDPRGSPA